VSRGSHQLPHAALGVAAMAALWVGGLHVGGLETGMLFLAPAFVLLLPLLAGRYPGELRLAGLQRPARRTAVTSLRLPRARLRVAPRGGLLVGCSLAGRAPPR
jgi:hypothetical protein